MLKSRRFHKSSAAVPPVTNGRPGLKWEECYTSTIIITARILLEHRMAV